MLGFDALGRNALGAIDDGVRRYATASQTLALPTQTATAAVIVAATSSKTLSLPAVNNVGDVDVAATGSILLSLPTQTATLFHPNAHRIKAQRVGYSFKARRIHVPIKLRRAA